MGKGDKKTRRGKITQGSYGKTRPKKSSKPVVIAEKSTKPIAEPKAEPKTAKPKAKKVETEEKPKPKRPKKEEKAEE